MENTQSSPANRFYPDDTCWFYNIARNEWVSANFRGYHEDKAIVVFEGRNWSIAATEVFSTKPEDK